MSKFLKALEQAERERATSLASPLELPTESVPLTAELSHHSSHLDPHLVSLTAPESVEAEQYRTLRASLEDLRGERGSWVIGISSPTPGDGKTTTAINLAATLAQGRDARVLLIETDLRRPVMSAQLGLPRTGAVSLVLGLREDGHSLESMVSRRPGLSLDVLLAGGRVDSPYELLKSPRMKRLVDRARERYDYVILDTPPLVSFADCQVLANWIDSFLIVVAAHRTPRRTLEEALGVVGRDKALGIVYNADDRPLIGSYYYLPPTRVTLKDRILELLQGKL